MSDRKKESSLTKELLSLGIVVDLEKNKTDEKERAVIYLFLNCVGQEALKIFCGED